MKPAMTWIDLKKDKPPPNARVLVCDENGYVTVEDVYSDKDYRMLGYPVKDMFDGQVPTFEQMWESGNGTKLVAWMPLPDWPDKLCNADANGTAP